MYFYQLFNAIVIIYPTKFVIFFIIQRRANVLRVAKQREALQREHLKESLLVREQELISKQN